MQFVMCHICHITTCISYLSVQYLPYHNLCIVPQNPSVGTNKRKQFGMSCTLTITLNVLTSKVTLQALKWVVFCCRWSKLSNYIPRTYSLSLSLSLRRRDKIQQNYDASGENCSSTLNVIAVVKKLIEKKK